LSNTLTSRGVTFAAPGRASTASFRASVERPFADTARLIVEDILLFGYSIIVLKDALAEADEHVSITHIPNYRGILHFRFQEGKTNYKFELHAHAPLPPHHHLLVYVDNDVGADGLPSTAVWAYVRTRRLYDTLERTYLSVMEHSASPLVYTQAKAAMVFSDDQALTLGADARVRDLLQQERLQNMDRLGEGASHANELAEALNKERVDTGPGSSYRHLTNSETGLPLYRSGGRATQRIVPLPPDTDVAKAPAPSCGVDLLAWRSHLREEACVALGVPPSLLTGVFAGNASGAASRSAEGMLGERLKAISSVVGGILVDCLILGYGDQTEGDLTCVFPSTLDPDIYKELLKEQMLSYQSYIDFIRLYHNMENVMVPPNGGLNKTDHLAL
jgi:hypothetical protein